MKNKICIIVPYFGEWPIWFELYLYSCSKNSFIDFYFFTDCKIPTKVYNNTKFIYLSFSEYCEKVSIALDLEFIPINPVKLCDIKPYIGIIHSDIVTDYDFWGFSDIDLIYGNLKIITEKLLNFDLVTTHADRIAGHFTIIRTNSEYTKMPLFIKDFKKKLLANNVVGLDEHDFTRLVYPLQPLIWSFYRHIGRKLGFKYYSFFSIWNYFSRICSKFYLKEYLTSILPKNGEAWYYNTSSGMVYGPSGELPYLHFLFFKKNRFYKALNSWEPGFFMLDSENIQQNLTIEITNLWIKMIK